MYVRLHESQDAQKRMSDSREDQKEHIQLKPFQLLFPNKVNNKIKCVIFKSLCFGVADIQNNTKDISLNLIDTIWWKVKHIPCYHSTVNIA